MDRREFLSFSGLCGAATAVGGGIAGCVGRPPSGSWSSPLRFELADPTVATLQRGMTEGRYTAVSLVKMYQDRIRELDQSGPALKSVIELNPDARRIAIALDRERRRRGPRGPLHGIPVLIKDNIDTQDGMTTTAGSMALAGWQPPHDAFLVERLRVAGSVLLGKTNLSEWANFRGSRSSSGWSGRGGQTRNPYFTDHNPSGSSSGSAVAVSANLCVVAVGTETDGSIVSPASYCGVVGIKPTVGLVSRRGIIPISSSQDTAGPMARCVADAAALLGAMVGEDLRDAATAGSQDRGQRDYTQFLDRDGLRSKRLGVIRSDFKVHRLADPVFEAALVAMQRCGAVLLDPVKLPAFDGVGSAEFQGMLYEFKAGLNAYLGAMGPKARVRSLAELIEFNKRHRECELPFFGQETLVRAQEKGGLDERPYLEARERCARWRMELATFFESEKLDALVAPTAGPAGSLDPVHGDHGLGGSSSYAAVAGFPSITVPCGEVWGLPVGMSFIGSAWQEPKLIAVAFAFEQATHARRSPRFQLRFPTS
ncbi:MAG: amidase [Pedosphaera sp.]|nr:amidase [Pedosphaera sp.]